MTNRIFTPFPTLKTERLILRQLVISDASQILILRSDESVNRYLDRRLSTSVEDAKSFVQTITEHISKNDSVYWAITLGGELIGTICLFEFGEDGSKAELGYELLLHYQRKGFMLEAASKIIEFAFLHLGLNAIEAYSHPENHNSTRLLQICNFIYSPGGAENPEELMSFQLLKINWKKA